VTIASGFCGRCGTEAQVSNAPCMSCGAPVWGLLTGLDDSPGGMVPVECPFCEHIDQVRADETARICSACHRTLTFQYCSRCSKVAQDIDDPGGFNCNWCESTASGAGRAISAAAYFADCITSASWTPTADGDLRWVSSCTVLAAAGVVFPAGTDCVLRFDINGLGIIEPSHKRGTCWPYHEVQVLELGGPGLVETVTGGGFIGGGFGVSGAARGMLAAAALNALTTRKKSSITTLIVLKTIDADLIFLHQLATPAQLQLDLTPAFLRLRVAHDRQNAQVVAPARTDAVSQLKELAALKAAGVLTEEEFKEAKRRVIQSIGQ
jgi:hypothetical protein